MGCCFSRSSGPNSPYPGGAPNASSRAINPPPLSLPEPAHGDNPRGASRRRRREQRPLDQHIDKPLRRHEWSSRDRSWTRRGIATERADFFDTRVTRRPEVWQTIHAALQVLWDPVDQDAQDDGSNGLATAQMILSAAEISLPTGNLVNGVYDALGNYYLGLRGPPDGGGTRIRHWDGGDQPRQVSEVESVLTMLWRSGELENCTGTYQAGMSR
ncbi:hypothetical protein EDB81DRAFT_863008 [Dactylonectria macrodidyma]|uniref:DC-UbP/UBTD2 N-terminal domain-containing protein n=1 Tax=Dactylonectria macrodidyma TaxID=307937 RepID=A0A9P9D1M2_9HYPO|nr:hypothetical protein EDB81DRAFT_863008 [Dactylonectria macrodidyma]